MLKAVGSAFTWDGGGAGGRVVCRKHSSEKVKCELRSQKRNRSEVG